MANSEVVHVDPKKVTERIIARREAEQVVELCRDSSTILSNESQALFWSIIRDHALMMSPLPKPTNARLMEPMSDSEARLMEQRVVPFGQYKGQRVHEVPLKYIDWLVGQKDTFREDLGRYLLNAQVMHELEKELAADHK